MNIVLLIISIVMNLFSFGILRNDFCKNECENDSDMQMFNAANSIFSCLTLLGIALVGGSLSAPSSFTIILGILYGLASALCAVYNMKALECGPLSYTCVIGSFAMIIPALSGLLFFGENVSVSQWIGVAVMLVSFVCAIDMKNDTAGTSIKWLLFCLVAFVFSGSVGILQKVHQASPVKDELSIFLIIAFVVSTVFSLLMTVFYRRKGTPYTVFAPTKLKKFVVFSIICGVGIALINQINLYLSGVLPSIVFYPIINGAPMLLATAAGLIFLKEKLSAKQLLGLIMGIAAIFLLCGIF